MQDRIAGYIEEGGNHGGRTNPDRRNGARQGNPFPAIVLAAFVEPILMSGNAWLISRVMRATMWLGWGVASLLILALWLAELMHLFVSALEVSRSPHEISSLVKKHKA
jgi:hypothetical protein